MQPVHVVRPRMSEGAIADQIVAVEPSPFATKRVTPDLLLDESPVLAISGRGLLLNFEIFWRGPSKGNASCHERKIERTQDEEGDKQPELVLRERLN